MKKLITIFFITLSLSISAQADYTELQNEVNAKAKALKAELEIKSYISDFEKNNTVSFKTDTFTVEETLRGKLDLEFSNNGMIEAIYDAEKEYDKLLNKYYKVLMGLLIEEDKEVLKQAQRNWITFRDSEKNLAFTITQSQYSGGGTMWDLSLAYETMNITKQRVLELYNHISRFYEYEY